MANGAFTNDQQILVVVSKSLMLAPMFESGFCYFSIAFRRHCCRFVPAETLCAACA